MSTRDIRLTPTGITPGFPQTWGAVRLVPLLRAEPITDLRLMARSIDALGIVDTGTANYIGYLPHALVCDWTDDGAPVVAGHTALGSKDVRSAGRIAYLKRMVKREQRHRFRMLPMDIAVEGFLGVAFGGPPIRSRWWTRTFERHGFQQRSLDVVWGTNVEGLREAVAAFERHPQQVGMLVFIDDELASVTLMGHPDDYAPLHHALISTYYGTMFRNYGWGFREAPVDPVHVTGSSMTELRRALQRTRDEQAAWSLTMAEGVFNRTVRAQRIRTAGRFELVLFRTGNDARRQGGEHLGEALLTKNGHIAYMRTYRLDRRQIRQGYLLEQLAAHDWNPVALASAQGHGDVQRIRRDLEAAGLPDLISEHPRYAASPSSII